MWSKIRSALPPKFSFQGQNFAFDWDLFLSGIHAVGGSIPQDPFIICLVSRSHCKSIPKQPSSMQGLRSRLGFLCVLVFAKGKNSSHFAAQAKPFGRSIWFHELFQVNLSDARVQTTNVHCWIGHGVVVVVVVSLVLHLMLLMRKPF